MTFTVPIDSGTVPASSTSIPISFTALTVQCGLGHEMVQLAPVRYECKQCGFTVVILCGGKS